MKKSHIAILRKVGITKCLEAAELYKQGEGCSTVGFYLNLHWKTASAAMDIGRLLPSIPYSYAS